MSPRTSRNRAAPWVDRARAMASRSSSGLLARRWLGRCGSVSRRVRRSASRPASHRARPSNGGDPVTNS